MPPSAELTRLLALFENAENFDAVWAALSPAQQAMLEAHWAEQDQQPIVEIPPAHARSTGRVTGGPLLEKEGRKVKSELRVLFRWRHKNGKAFPESELENFIEKLCADLHPRDPLDPNSVSPQDLGAHFRLTYLKRRWIENEETKRRTDMDWRGRYGKNPLFRFKQIGVDPADAPPEIVSERYLDLRMAAYNQRRRDARTQNRETKMQTGIIEQSKPTNGLLDERMAQTRAQIDAVRKALADGEWHKRSDLLKRVCHGAPSWSGVAPSKRYQTLVDRLKMIGGEIENKEAPGPRGSILKLVRRRDPNPLH